MNPEKSTYVAYSAEPRVRQRWASLLLWFELIRNLAVRDVETRYKHSLLGLYWAIINPMVQAGIYGFVFGLIFHARSPEAHLPYVVYLLTGLTFWNLFANGVTSATVSVTGSAALLAKLYFPRVVLPTASVVARLIDFSFSLVVLAVFILLYGVHIYWTALWLIPLVGVELLFTLGVGYIVAALNVLYRDISQLIGLVLMLWLWGSPIMYSIQGVPSWLQGLLLLNPMGALIQAQDSLLYRGQVSIAPFLWAAGCWAAFLFFAGLTLFKRVEPVFAEVM